MEFNNQYLTYAEYKELGGALEETPFNILEVEARKNIDRHTFGRLIELESQVNEVKLCDFKLIELLNTYSFYDNKNKGIASETIDGYNINYINEVEKISIAKSTEIKSIIKTYLSECKLENGTPYLYVGV